MRWSKARPLAGAVVLLLGLLCAGPAAAQQGPDHLHVDLALVGCGTLKATGFKLPPSTRLDLRFVNPSSGGTLRRTTATTDAAGTLALTAEVPLVGVRTVRMTVGRAGADKPFAFSELTIPGACPLPFTGPPRWPTLTGLALCLLLVGSMLVRASAYRGRHRQDPARRVRVMAAAGLTATGSGRWAASPTNQRTGPRSSTSRPSSPRAS
jgi:hypothetical protein